MSNPMNEYKAKFQRLAELRTDRDITKRAADKANEAYREAESELFEELKEAGIRGRITFDFGGDLGTISFQPRATKFGRIIDRDTAIAALKAEGLDEMIYEEAIREKRLNELVRDRLEARKDFPDGVDYYERRSIAISRK